jgi:hypothetical protein
MSHERASAESLGLLRFAVFGTFFVLVWQTPIRQLAHLPRATFTPQGVLRGIPAGVWDVLLREQALAGLRIVLLGLLFVTALSLVQSRAITLLCTVVLVGERALVDAFSAVPRHDAALLAYVAIVLAVLPVHDGLTLRPADAPTRARHAAHYRLGFLVPAAVLVSTYFFVGFVRVLGGAEIYTDGSLHGWVVGHWMGSGTPDGATLALPGAPYGFVPDGAWGALFLVGTAIEVSAPLALLWRPARIVVASGLVLFHVSIHRLLGVGFPENIVLIALLLSTVWPHRIAAAAGRIWPRWPGATGAQPVGQDDAATVGVTPGGSL